MMQKYKSEKLLYFFGSCSRLFKYCINSRRSTCVVVVCILREAGRQIFAENLHFATWQCQPTGKCSSCAQFAHAPSNPRRFQKATYRRHSAATWGEYFYWLSYQMTLMMYLKHWCQQQQQMNWNLKIEDDRSLLRSFFGLCPKVLTSPSSQVSALFPFPTPIRFQRREPSFLAWKLQTDKENVVKAWPAIAAALIISFLTRPNPFSMHSVTFSLCCSCGGTHDQLL